MAASTLCTELPLVLILVTGEAIAAEAQKGPVVILHLDFGTRRRGDLFFVVTAFALLLKVLSDERIAGLRKVIEAFAVEAREYVAFAVVFHMAACAILLTDFAIEDTRVKSGLRFYPAPDFGMTVKTGEGSSTLT